MNSDEQPKMESTDPPADESLSTESISEDDGVVTPVAEPDDTAADDTPNQPIADGTEVVPVAAMPAENEPTPQPVDQSAAAPALTTKPSKKKKFVLFAVIGAVLLALGGGAWATYALWYNNPDNAVADAFSKALVAKSGSATGSFTVKTDDATLKVDMSSAVNEAKQSSADIALTITASDNDYKLNGHFAGTQDELYIKLDDLRSVLTQTMGSEYSEMIDAYYGSLLDKIDGKWVVIKQSDLESLSSGTVSDKETQCVENEVAKLQADASLRNELTDVYKKNPLFIVEAKGSDSDGNRYNLVPVGSEKAHAFTTAIAETKFFKAIDDCTSSDLKKSFTEESSDSSTDSDTTGSLEVWIDGWSHTINKIAVSVKDDSTDMSGDIKTTFNTNPAVTIPKGETTFDDLKSEIEDITSQLFGSYSESATYELPDTLEQ